MHSLYKKILSFLPLLVVGLIAWFSYTKWLNYTPANIVLSNAIEAKDVKVSSKVAGRITKTLIKEGDKVKKGQKLLELEGDEIIAQLKQAKASLSKAQADYKDLLLGARPQEIIQATAQTTRTNALLEEANLKYKNAFTDFQRMQELFNQGAVSKQKFDQYETQKALAEQEIINLKQEKTKSEKSEDLIKEGARKEQLKSLFAQVEYYKAKVEELEKYVSELSVITPLDGEVSSFDLKSGELIKANQPLITITDLSDIYVRVYIPNTKLGKVKLNQVVKIKADPFADDTFDGYISYIGAQAEYTPRNIQTPEERTKLVYPVKIQIKNKENKLRDGMYVTVNL